MGVNISRISPKPQSQPPSSLPLEVKQLQEKEVPEVGTSPALSRDKILVSKKIVRSEKKTIEKATPARHPAIKKADSLPIFIPHMEESVEFFERHISWGQGTIQIGQTAVTFDKGGHGKVDINKLVKDDPLAKTIVDMAKKYKITIGFWGGTARDLLCGRKRSPASDVDLVYDSREANFFAFRKALLKEIKEKFGDKAPHIDFAVDKNPVIMMKGPYRGMTVEKLALLADGSVYDFTGKGLKDLSQGILRYNSSEPFQPPGISSIFRMVGAKIQTGFDFDPQTEALIKEIMQKYYGPDSENVKNILKFKKITNGSALEKFLQNKNISRKKFGENYPQLMSILNKIVTGNQDTDPARALKILQDYGIVDFLKSIESENKLKPLQEAAKLQSQTDFQRLIENMKQEALKENVYYGLRMLADNFRNREQHSIAQKLDRYSKDHIVIPEDKDIFSTIEALMQNEINNGEIKPKQLRNILNRIFYRYRGNKVYKELFDIQPLENIPLSFGSPPDKTVTKGFDPEVAKIDPRAPHSMKDIKKYINNRLGEFMIRDMIKNKRIIEIHSGSREEAFASLRARGFTRLARVYAPKASLLNQIYLAQSDKGETRYVFTEIYGKDRLTHYQLLLRYAHLDNQYLDPQQIEIHRDPVRDKIDTYRKYTRALLRSGVVPNNVIIGFKNSIIAEIKSRAEAAEKLSWLQSHLGENPLQKLFQKLSEEAAANSGKKQKSILKIKTIIENNSIINEALSLKPEEVFKSHKNVTSIQKAEQILAKIAQNHPWIKAISSLFQEGKIPVGDKKIAQATGDYFSDQGLITYIDEQGRHKALLLVRTPYGDNSGDLGKALVDYGTKDILIIGTAGGLEKNDKIGEIDIPGSFYNINDEALQGISNQLLEFIHNRKILPQTSSEMQLDAHLRDVKTPLEETATYIKNLKSKGYNLVDTEVSDLIEGLLSSKEKVKFGSAQIISDIPETEKTLESYCPRGAIEKSVKELTDVIIAYLKMQKVEPIPPEQKQQTAFEQASQLAQKLMKTASLSLEDRELMSYNLTRYLINGTTPEALNWLNNYFDGSPQELSATNMIGSRWMAKIERTFAQPYTNKEVFLNIQKQSKKLKELVQFIQENRKPNSSYTLYLAGSFAKGRYSATSDLDVLLDTDDDELMEKVVNSQFGYKGATDRSFVVGPLDYVAARIDFYKPPVEIGEGKEILTDKEFLEKIYTRIAAYYGVKFNPQGEKVNIDFDKTLVTKTAKREVPLAAEKLLEYEKSYRNFMDTDFILKYLYQTHKNEELGYIPLNRLLEIGEKLIPDVINKKFTPIALESFFNKPRGKDILQICGLSSSQLIEQARDGKIDISSLLSLEDVIEIVGLSDPVECLALFFAGAERFKHSPDKQKSPFACEIKEAIQNW